MSQCLIDAAFGTQPDMWPLPAAATDHQRWLRAVAAAGQGRYAAARADLAELRRRTPAGPLASLAHSTQGSLLRQLGWHDVARGWDGRALALAGDEPEARVDALIGLAADALGVGRFAPATALLKRVDDVLPGTPDRLAVRRSWVAGELAMAMGEGRAAVRHAEHAVELAQELTGVRHQVKSDVVLAAALCCAGATDRARVVADRALEATGRYGLLPLRWALACLLADIGSTSPQEMAEIRDVSAALIEDRGGRWRTG